MGDSNTYVGYAATSEAEGPKKKKVVVDGYEIPSSVAKVEYKEYGSPKFSLDINVKDVKVTEEGIFATTRYQADNIEKLLRMGGKPGQLTPEGEKIKALEEDMKRLQAERTVLIEEAKRRMRREHAEQMCEPTQFKSPGTYIGRVLTSEEENRMQDELTDLRKAVSEKGL